MNAFWIRANAAGALQPLLKVVETELIIERDRKTAASGHLGCSRGRFGRAEETRAE